MPRSRRRGSTLLSVSRLALGCACTFAFAFVLCLMPGDAQAYPFMIRHGYSNCSGCHTDPSGGELLTLYGHAISYEVLSTRWGGGESSSAATERRIARAVAQAAGSKSAQKKAAAKKKPADDEDLDDEELDDEELDELDDENLDEELDSEGESADSGGDPSPFEGMSGLTGPLLGFGPASESFLIGGSLRFATNYKLDAAADKFAFFPMQLDLYAQMRLGSSFRVGTSLGTVKVPPGSPHGRAAQLTTNQSDGYNLISRTHWVGFDFGGGAHTVRAGRLNLPYGIRLAEHVLWARERTQTDRESDQQHGVALYMGFDSVRFELMGILGNFQVNPDRYRERGYSGYVEMAAAENVAVGLSSLYTFAGEDRLEPSDSPLATMRQAHGPFVRAAPAESVAILAEANILTRSRRGMGYVGFLQVDVEAFQGFHLIGTGELLNAGLPDLAKQNASPRVAGLGRPALGGWLSLQWFFLPHFDLRVDAIIRQDKQILSQLHIYL